MKKSNGITLIALVITIIVLLILAGISITTLTGENGVLTKAITAKKNTQRADIIERARIEILGVQSDNQGNVKNQQVKDIIAKYDKDYDENKKFQFKEKDGEEYIETEEGYEILVNEIFILGVDEIAFSIEGFPLTAFKGETWRQWIDRHDIRFSFGAR